MNFAEYPAWDAPRIVGRLAEVYQGLAETCQDEGRALAGERRAKVEAYVTSEETSMAARDKEADAAAVDFTTTFFEVRAERQALEAERDFLLLLYGRLG